MMDSQLKKEQWDFVGTAGVSVQPSGATTTELEKTATEVDHQFIAAVRNTCSHNKNKRVKNQYHCTVSVSSSHLH